MELCEPSSMVHVAALSQEQGAESIPREEVKLSLMLQFKLPVKIYSCSMAHSFTHGSSCCYKEWHAHTRTHRHRYLCTPMHKHWHACIPQAYSPSAHCAHFSLWEKKKHDGEIMSCEGESCLKYWTKNAAITHAAKFKNLSSTNIQCYKPNCCFSQCLQVWESQSGHKHFSFFVSHRTLDILSPEVNTSKIHYNVVYKDLVRS